jgi:hypothetical protein
MAMFAGTRFQKLIIFETSYLQVLVTLWNIPQHKFYGTYQVLIFVNCTADAVLSGKIGKQDPNYAGFVTIFNRGKSGMKHCGKCVENDAKGKRFIFTFDISLAVRSLGLKINPIPRDSDISPDEGQPYQFSMAFVAELCPGQLKPLDEVCHHVFTRAPGFPNIRE